MNKYLKAFQDLRGMYQGIGDYCKECEICCFTYGWLLASEVDTYSESNLIEINGKVTCIDSFKRDSEGKRELGKIPRCKYYKKNRCTIHNKKPFDCLLYPTKILYCSSEKSFKILLSLDCPYIASLPQDQMDKLTKRVKRFILQMPKGLLKEYLIMVKEWDRISKQKDFESLEVYSIKEEILNR